MTLDTGSLRARQAIRTKPWPPAREGLLSRWAAPNAAGTALTHPPSPPVSCSQVLWQLVMEARRCRALRGEAVSLSAWVTAEGSGSVRRRSLGDCQQSVPDEHAQTAV